MNRCKIELDSSAFSDIGPVREENQDSTRLSDTRLPAEDGFLFAVADGMGGYANGALASRQALDTLYETFYKEYKDSSARALRRGVEMANLDVYKTSQRLSSGTMGTTLTAAYLHGETLQIVHVGDSRAYLLRSGRSTCLTDDHTTVGDLVRMRVLAPEKVRTHARRSILTRGVGLVLMVKPDLHEIHLQEGDRVVLCSDGVWSVIEDDEFAILSTHSETADELSHSLVEAALERQTDDNASAVVIHVKRLIPSAHGKPLPNGRGWAAKVKNLFSRQY